MKMQLTFNRGNFIGHWVEDEPDDLGNYLDEILDSPPVSSGSLEILFKGKCEAILPDTAEHAAEKVFTNYAEPDHHHLAEQIVDNFLQNDMPLSVGLKAVWKDDRHIQHDVDVVRQIMKSLITNEGYDPSELSVFDFDVTSDEQP